MWSHTAQWIVADQVLLCRQSFHPVPGVDSAVAEFILHKEVDERVVGYESAFVAFVNAAFSMKRKTLINNMKSWNTAMLPRVEACLDSCGLPVKLRAEALDVGAFVALFACLHQPTDNILKE